MKTTHALSRAAFTISYTLIFIALYARMSDIMGESKVAMTGAIATFKDLGYTIGPLVAGMLMVFITFRAPYLSQARRLSS